MKYIRQFLLYLRGSEQRVSTASILLIFMVTLGKIIGFLKLHFIARFFGISQELDIFWAAFALPDFVFALLVVGTVNAALIPVFIKIQKKEKPEVLTETVNTILAILIGILAIVGILIYFAIPVVARMLFSGQSAFGVIQLDPALSQASNENYIQLYINLSRLMLASPIILTVSSVLSAYLQSFKRFTVSSLAPVFYNIGILVGLFVFVLFAPQYGVYALGYSVIIGSLFHLLVQIPAILSMHKPEKFTLKINSYVKEILRLSGPRVFGLGVEQIAMIFNTFWSFTLGAGALSAFKFASSLHLLPVDILSGSFLQAIFPHMNEAANKDDKFASLNRLYVKALTAILLVGIPVVIAFITLRIPMVRLIYGAGRFSWSATVATSFVLAFFAPAILLQAIASLNIRVFYSLHNTRTPVIASIIGVILSISFSILFTNYFSHYHEFRSFFESFLATYDIGAFIQNIWQTWGWFMVRNNSFAAVAGLAFGLSFALFFEVLISFVLLSRTLKLGAYLKQHPTFRRDSLHLSAAGIVMFVTSYLIYRLGDAYVLNTEYTSQLIILSIVVGVIPLLLYFFVAQKIWKQYIKLSLRKRILGIFGIKASIAE